MTRISIELVPRSLDTLRVQATALKTAYPHLHTVNIPDLLRLDIRSWEACRFTKSTFRNNIPHLRAVDFDLGRAEIIYQAIADFHEVLVVSGDPAPDGSTPSYDTQALDLIHYLKRTYPNLKVYAALDPHRSALRQEIEYALDKLDHGADGFFTQPFFSLDQLKMVQEQLPDEVIFWGISPVVGDRSRSYWERVNNVAFPPEYRFDLAGNQAFARSMLDYIRSCNGDAYFMPIKVSPEDYFSGIFPPRQPIELAHSLR